MSDASDAVESAIKETANARNLVNRLRTNQVRGRDKLAVLKATALSWFNTHRVTIASLRADIDLKAVDSPYSIVLEATSKSATRGTYLSSLQAAKTALLQVQSLVLMPPSLPPNETDDVPPDFSPLAANEEMRSILTRRWQECCKCVRAHAHLAAIVMMGGLLEALFVARANKLSDKTELVNAKSAPTNSQTGRTLNYQEWMLDSYIKVGCELSWITESARGIADVLKEYRNYVHPEKERRHGITLELNDSEMFWAVTKTLVRQLLISSSKS